MKTYIQRSVSIALFAAAAAFFPLAAEAVTITQIDPSSLLATQTVRLFLDIAVPASEGEISADKLKVSESADGVSYTEVPVRGISRTAARDEGISFFFLLDNSGSMWDDLDGKPTADPASTRIAHAKRAVNEFVLNLSALDRAGLAAFNTNYAGIKAISSDASGIPDALAKIGKPAREDAYTELYGSIATSLSGFGEEGRRKVLIVLSDGENFPFDAAKSTATPDDGIEAAAREGITCYVVNFANAKDAQVHRIATGSGGLVFDARNSDELLGIYNTIRSNILEEYSVTYTAAMLSGDKRYVKVTYAGNQGAGESVRYYYSGTVLGSNTEKLSWWYLLFFAIPLLIWLALLLFKLEKETTEAGIQLLYGAKGMQTKAFTLTGAQTIIGGDATADITIAGNPSMKGNAATILFDKTRQQYTISASSDLTVNNKPVKTKILDPGDVINMSGTVVVFDNKTQEKKK